jgi:D-alanine-D-alanine ligase
MKVAVVFDSPYPGWDHDDHEARMHVETAASYGDEAMPEYQVAHALRARGHEVYLVGSQHDPSYVTQFLSQRPVDIVFNVTEGFRHADDLDFLVPAMLEAEGQPYTGATPQSLILTRNKAISKKILRHHGVLVPQFESWRIGEKVPSKIGPTFPMIVKPLRLDASVGISKSSVVHDRDELAERVAFIHERVGDAAIAEQFVEGRELYVSVMGNGRTLEILPVVEMVFDSKVPPEARIATHAVKWDSDYCERNGIRTTLARRLSKVAMERIHHACRTAYHALWLRDYARFDLRLDDEDRVWLIEANANPYICDGHEIAKAARKAGMDYPTLVERIVKIARKRYKNGLH